MRDRRALNHAKQLRTEQTSAETRLWYHLRARRFGDLKFRRQTPIGPFIADFTCRAAMLVIEIDGDTHAGSAARDARRTAFLEGRGWRVIRFTNADVIGNVEGALAEIARAVSGHSP